MSSNVFAQQSSKGGPVPSETPSYTPGRNGRASATSFESWPPNLDGFLSDTLGSGRITEREAIPANLRVGPRRCSARERSSFSSLVLWSILNS